MNENLRAFQHWFWLSLAMTIFLGFALFIATRRRHLWLRYTTAEAAFWLRLGLPEKLVTASRRFSESEKNKYAFWIVICLWAILTFLSGGSYLYFKHRLPIERPREAVAFYDAGAGSNKAGDYFGAISNFSKAIRVYSNYAEAYSFRARAKYNLADYHGAITDATKAVQLNPDWSPAYNVRGFSKFYLQDYRGSVEDFDRFIKLDTSYAYIYNQRGLARANLTNYPAAIDDFTKAIKLKPDYAMAYYDRGLVKLGITNYAAAIVDFSNAVQFHPDFPDAYNRQGLAEWHLGNFSKAIVDYNKAIELDPDFWPPCNNRGLVESDLNHYAEAIVDYDKSINLNRTNAIVYFNRGMAKYHLGNNAGAVADYQKAIELEPDDASVYANLGLVQNDLFQFESALKNYRKALQFDSVLDECRFRIWLILSRSDDRPGATEDLKEYLDSQKHKKLTWSEAVGFFLVGEFSEKSFLACAKSSDEKTQIWWRCRSDYYAGMKHLISGDKIGAMDFFQQCLHTKETNFSEFISAKAELKALKNVIPP